MPYCSMCLREVYHTLSYITVSMILFSSNFLFLVTHSFLENSCAICDYQIIILNNMYWLLSRSIVLVHIQMTSFKSFSEALQQEISVSICLFFFKKSIKD